jgi:hypothetical protein
VLFVKEEGHGEVTDLFLRVFVRRNKIDGFKMSEVDVPTENVYVKKLDNCQSYRYVRLISGATYLAHVFLLVISAKAAICIQNQ